MSRLNTAATVKKFQDFERRLASAGLYRGPVDDDWGDGVDGAIEQLFVKAGFKGTALGSSLTAGPAAVDQSAVQWPANYAWLADLGPLPRLVVAGGHLLGTKETVGAASNPTIMGWKQDLAAIGKDVAGYTSDAVPWCGLGMGKIAIEAGYRDQIPQHPLWALNWGDFGVPAKQPCLGSILTFLRDTGGHVALYIAEDQASYHVLGCNQSDNVTITRIAKSRLKACREPAYNARPPSARPFVVSAFGALSTNER